MREHRDAGRGARPHRLVVDLEFLHQRHRDLFGQFDAGRRLLAVDDQAELVAAEPRHHAATRAILQALGDLDQHLVAHRMAEHVVDFLQAVEVDAQHREFLVGALAGLDHLGQRLQEGGAVRQIGQAVMIGHVRHARLGLAAVGDVLVGLDQILRLAGIVEHRHAAGQEQPQAVLGRDRVFLGEQAALLDRRLVARDDQLGFARIEDIGGGQSGGILAAAVEDGFGAAVGEQIFSVRDAFDDQRHRNIVDHEFEELLGALQFERQRPAVGDVVEQRNQEFGFVLLVARDHPVGGEDALFVAALDHEFSAVITFRRLQRRLVRRLDAAGGLETENLVGALADDVIAREARETLERAVGEDIAAVLDVLGGDADRNVIEHRFQELRGRGQLARKLALLGAILMGCDRPAVRQAEIFHQHRFAVGQFGDQALRGGGLGVEFIDADIQRAALAPHFQQFRPGHVAGNIRAHQAVDFEIAVVAEDDALLRVGHHHALAEIVQGGIDEGTAPELRALEPAQQ